MRPSPAFSSRLLVLGGAALLALCVGMSACQRSEEPPASSEPAPASGPTVSAPFDVQAVIRRAERSFQPRQAGTFTGDQDTYALEVDADGTVRLAPRQSPVAPEPRGPEHASRKKEVTQPVTAAPLALRTVSVTRGTESLARGLEPSVRKDGALALGRGPVVEVLENGDAGMEQRWEWAAEPEGEGDLEVRVAVSGQEYAGRTEHGHHFVDRETGLGTRYGRATWVDAAGRRTDVETTWEQGALVLRVPAGVLEGSAWPAVLDPVVSPEIALDVPVPVPNRVINTRQAVAFGAGMYLVVWTHRTVGAQDDVLMARVRASDGVVLDVGSLAVVGG
ncbi:hypothetical protein HG543_46550, partial [Pyxidicoccus fallax]|nr:hypothetical protein [Pyxidicoccus fallax]